MTIQVSMVPAAYAFGVWPKVRPLLTPAAEYSEGRFEVEDMLELIVDGEHELWIAFDGPEVKGVVTSSIIEYPRKRVLCLHFIGGGDLKEWKAPMLEVLQQWGFDNQCTGIESTGRSGWARVLKDDGVQLLWHTFQLPVATRGLGGGNG